MKKSVSTGIVLGLILAVFLWRSFSKIDVAEPDSTSVLKLSVPVGATFGDLTKWIGINPGTATAVFESAKEKYNLAKIVSGRELAFVFDSFSGDLEKVVYKISSEDELIIDSKEGNWGAEVGPIPYEIKEKSTAGTVASSLYLAITESGNDERLALALAEMFAWQVDFVADTRVGDEFKAVYEERYLNGEYIMPGKILAARYTNDGETFYGYWWGSEKTKAGYYDEKGNSLQKQFLKAPLQYKYISSGYSYGRVNPVTRKVAPHRGIDYAAPAGTPAVSVGDGTIVQAGWNGPYGISVLVRHNDTYQSRYGHFSRLAKGIKVGAKVKQGQVVGYVGSTGESTGPHLHFEIHKFGSLVNPFKVEVPPGDPVNKEDMAQFQAIIDQYRSVL